MGAVVAAAAGGWAKRREVLVTIVEAGLGRATCVAAATEMTMVAAAAEVGTR